MRLIVPASLTLAHLCVLAPSSAHAATPAEDIAALRAEIDALRTSYEARLQALDARLRAAEAATKAPPPASAPAPAAAAATAQAAAPAAAPAAAMPAAVAPPPVAAAPVPTGAGGANSFNPALSLILSGTATHTSQDPARYQITGFALPPDAEFGPGTRGFSLAESELAFSANIDPWWRGAANIALEPDNSLSIEEAFVQTTALGNGFTVKAGRFFSAIGYLNSQHAHTWDFVDAPLAYQAMLGGQLNDDGVQLAWVAPTDLFIELALEAGRGQSFPGTDTSRNGAGRTSLALHVGGDVGASHSWRAGVSYMHAKATEQALTQLDAADSAIDSVFNGRTNVTVLDAVWKWAPNGNAVRTNFKLQGEWLRSSRSGTLAYDTAGANLLGDYGQDATGWYLQGIYQFMPRWRVGLRTERLDPGTVSYVGPTLLDANGYKPRKNSLMVDFSASEFSRLRLQYARDEARQGSTDNQWILQYQMSLGAHGAHAF
ncbi:MAG TPA: hypothetical protein VML58_14005 [Burkholderiaceae bacterium]|nr:hypothetical protein [Burkholderiaceae bacterium]